MGFKPFAYRGLETGERSVASHAVKQNKVCVRVCTYMCTYVCVYYISVRNNGQHSDIVQTFGILSDPKFRSYI